MVELPTASLLKTIACNKHWDTYENDLYSSSSQGHDIFTLRSFLFLFSILFPEEEEPAHPWIRDFKGKIENNMLMPK